MAFLDTESDGPGELPHEGRPGQVASVSPQAYEYGLDFVDEWESVTSFAAAWYQTGGMPALQHFRHS